MSERANVEIRNDPEGRVVVHATLPPDLSALPEYERRRIVEETFERCAAGSMARLARIERGGVAAA